MFACRRLFCVTEGCIFARASRVAIVCRSEWNTMPFFETRRIQSARPVTRAAPVRIVANEFDVPQPGFRHYLAGPGLTIPSRPAYNTCRSPAYLASLEAFAEEGDMLWSSIGRLRLAAATALLATTPAFAQSTGQVTGVVKDSTGAALPDATVTVTGADGAKHEASTSPDGSYTVSGLPPGNYSVSAAHVGFRTALQQRQAVAAAGTLTVDFTLETNLVTNLTEEITVTAMKREDVVRKVPFSMTATSEETLRVRGATDIEDVAANVGGFSVQNLGPGQSQVAMRGVSSGQIARDQPGVKEQVGVYLDESPIAMSLFTPDLDLFDISRVEVLRGPQGTLFGAGSESGTVRYNTNQPEIAPNKGFAEFDGSSLRGGDFGGDFKLGGNFRLSDTAAMRVVGYYNRLGGFIDAVQPDLSVKKHVNRGDRTGGRVSFLLAPNDRLSITPRFVYQRVKMDGWNRIDAFNI